MHVFITGATGLIGGKLKAVLESSGHQVTGLTRSTPKSDSERQWDPSADSMDPSLLDGCNVLVHLAGESIADGRWNDAKKKRIRESRVNSTRLLAETISAMDTKPQAFVVASAIGYYGDRGDEVLTEASTPGEGFLADVCVEWEAAATPAKEADIRTVHVRTGIVLSSEGGALKSMLLPFKLGAGGNMGNGQQYWSWISIDDIVAMFQFAVENDAVSGPINGTAPQPCTNAAFTKELGKALSRPTLLPMPGFAAKLVLGEMAEALILSSARVVPEQTVQSGFHFQHTELDEALKSLDL